jgi:hypothetical protein
MGDVDLEGGVFNIGHYVEDSDLSASVHLANFSQATERGCG